MPLKIQIFTTTFSKKSNHDFVRSTKKLKLKQKKNFNERKKVFKQVTLARKKRPPPFSIIDVRNFFFQNEFLPPRHDNPIPFYFWCSFSFGSCMSVTCDVIIQKKLISPRICLSPLFPCVNDLQSSYKDQKRCWPKSACMSLFPSLFCASLFRKFYSCALLYTVIPLIVHMIWMLYTTHDLLENVAYLNVRTTAFNQKVFLLQLWKE